MAITNKTRKLLWGKSGNRCAICRSELVTPATLATSDVLIGDECHINGRKDGSPRWDPTLSGEYLDSYENLILLCKVHHKVIDDQPISFSVEGLRSLKSRHEKWVKNNLCPKPKNLKTIDKFASRIRFGKDILSIVCDAHFYDFDYDEPENPEEIEFISIFLETAQDYGDFGDSIEAGNRVEIGIGITSQIRRLERLGYWVFGFRDKRNLKIAGQDSTGDVAVLRILKKDNKAITLNTTEKFTDQR